jgi:hypothetical protein
MFIETPGEPDSDAEWGWFLMDEMPTHELTADQERRLAWWLTDGPAKLGESRRAGILAVYVELVAKYEQWRAAARQGEEA